ncbi:uncharacterized protein LOC127524814 [Ctenopharyngodon idella]|uniref:uncharacterized protein LOC127524814 n=1 Tax=Ctenopharyngodon idella TaxID=7959 RepID=UPI002230E10C|nr:uncharacterized protein LOC127524814 [Ctenopharyngodon idella]XP_051772735.1 uncharacterized protein LOC127524814 [Ctenopharyngodon idella]XP_051772736.1 uncharacterized protein LOC127524814 [Ctenopharyngodon idella]
MLWILFYFLFDFVLLSSPQLILPPSHRYLPSVPQRLLSVVSLHLKPAGSHLFLAVGSLWLRLCLCTLHSSSTRRPGSCVCAPSYLDVGSDHQAFSLAGLPQYVGSTWVGYHYTYAADLQAGHCSPALHPFSFGQLLPPSGSASAFGRSSSTSALWILSRVVVTAAMSWPPRSSESLRYIGHRPSSTSSLPPVVPMVASVTTSTSLLPPATPPWGAVSAVAWVSNYLPLLKAQPGLKPSTSRTASSIICPFHHLFILTSSLRRSFREGAFCHTLTPHGLSVSLFSLVTCGPLFFFPLHNQSPWTLH